jgi:hypothetical protein
MGFFKSAALALLPLFALQASAALEVRPVHPSSINDDINSSQIQRIWD